MVLVSPGRRRPAAGAARDHRAGSVTLRLRPGEPSVELWCLDLADADGRGPWGDAVMDYFKKSKTVKTELRNCGRFATARTGHRAPRHRTCKRCGTVGAGPHLFARGIACGV